MLAAAKEVLLKQGRGKVVVGRLQKLENVDQNVTQADESNDKH